MKFSHAAFYYQMVVLSDETVGKKATKDAYTIYTKLEEALARAQSEKEKVRTGKNKECYLTLTKKPFVPNWETRFDETVLDEEYLSR